MDRQCRALGLVLAAVLAWGASGAAGQVPGSQPAPVRRFALVAGSNGGAAGQTRLRYAASDARSFAAVLTELGGVSQNDLILLVDPSLTQLRESFSRMRRAVAGSAGTGQKSLFILYYSGHSDESGLELGSESLGYDRLRSDIEGVGADIQLAIVDSCSSGSFTRAKGGTARPAFLFDASTETTGHAYLTSSSADESAQESDRLGGSFFTHYLVSGLRGAADLDGKGVVTLNEAYAFAFKETLASTENTRFGPQHPAYDIHLTGSGDLVLTDLRLQTAGLTLARDLGGRLYIRDARGTLALELGKEPGGDMELALEPGSYGVVLERGGAHFGATVTIASGKWTALSASDFHPLSSETTLPRGGAAATPGGRIVALALGIIPDLRAGLFSSSEDRRFSLNALAGSSGSVSGFELSGLWNSDSRTLSGFQAAGIGNAVAGQASAFQVAGLVNYVGRDLRYTQFAGFGNMAGGDLGGAQIAGFGNLILGDGNGAQIAGAVNYAGGRVRGAQVSGAANIAGSVNGAQVSALNISSQLEGAQIGVVNVGGIVRGTQIGLVNVAEEFHGLPLGLVSVEKGGIRAFELSWEGAGSPASFGIKLGTRHSYTLVSLGSSVDVEGEPWSFGLGFGGRVGLGGPFIDMDLATRVRLARASTFADFRTFDPESELRVQLGLPVGGLAAMIGVALDYAWPDSSAALRESLSSGSGLVPRFSVGLQF
ncbi:MAG TPA: caspase family protein [Rectinemataceae bacterium]|nr:caspase family protein [Rectinemataceae bacterium]